VASCCTPALRHAAANSEHRRDKGPLAVTSLLESLLKSRGLFHPAEATWLKPATPARCSRTAPRARPNAAASRRAAPPARDGAVDGPAGRSSSTSGPGAGGRPTDVPKELTPAELAEGACIHRRRRGRAVLDRAAFLTSRAGQSESAHPRFTSEPRCWRRRVPPSCPEGGHDRNAVDAPRLVDHVRPGSSRRI